MYNLRVKAVEIQILSNAGIIMPTFPLISCEEYEKMSDIRVTKINKVITNL